MRREPQTYLRGELVVVIDCSQLDRSAEFWTGVLEYVQDGVATGRYQSLLPENGPGAEILLQRGPEGKQAKNRVHLDLRTRELESELHRLTSLGARVLTGNLSPRPDGAGTSWPTQTATSSACWSRPLPTGRIDLVPGDGAAGSSALAWPGILEACRPFTKPRVAVRACSAWPRPGTPG